MSITTANDDLFGLDDTYDFSEDTVESACQKIKKIPWSDYWMAFHPDSVGADDDNRRRYQHFLPDQKRCYRLSRLLP